MCLVCVQKQKLMDFDEVEVGIWFAVPQICACEPIRIFFAN